MHYNSHNVDFPAFECHHLLECFKKQLHAFFKQDEDVPFCSNIQGLVVQVCSFLVQCIFEYLYSKQF